MCNSPETVKEGMPETQKPGNLKTKARNPKTRNACIFRWQKELKMLGELYSPWDDLNPEMILISLCVSPEMIPDEFIEWQLNMGLWIAQRL